MEIMHFSSQLKSFVNLVRQHSVKFNHCLLWIYLMDLIITLKKHHQGPVQVPTGFWEKERYNTMDDSKKNKKYWAKWRIIQGIWELLYLRPCRPLQPMPKAQVCTYML
jgi:hypothetical protein